MSITPKNYSSIWRIALLIFAGHTVFFLIQLPQVYLYGVQSPQNAFDRIFDADRSRFI